MNLPVVGFPPLQDMYHQVCTILVKSLYCLLRCLAPRLPYKYIMSSSKDKAKGPGKSWAKIANKEDIYERDPNGLFVICIVCGEVNIRRHFDSRSWFDHKGGQLHNHKKHNEISEKAWLDKASNTGTNTPATNQISMISIVSHTKRSKYDIPANVASLHK